MVDEFVAALAHGFEEVFVGRIGGQVFELAGVGLQVV